MKVKFAVLVLMGAVLATSGAASARSTLTKPYIKKNGTYVAPSLRTSPDRTKLNNYSTKGNVNPYSGKAGTVDPYKVKPALKIYGR